MALAYVGTNKFSAGRSGFPDNGGSVNQAKKGGAGKFYPTGTPLSMGSPHNTPSTQVVLVKYTTFDDTVIKTKVCKGDMVFCVLLCFYDSGPKRTVKSVLVNTCMLNALLHEHTIAHDKLRPVKNGWEYGTTDNSAWLKSKPRGKFYSTKEGAPLPFPCDSDGGVLTENISFMGIVGNTENTFATSTDNAVGVALGDTLVLETVSLSCTGGDASAPVPLNFVELGVQKNTVARASSSRSNGIRGKDSTTDFAKNKLVYVYIGGATQPSLQYERAQKTWAIPVVCNKMSYTRWKETQGHGTPFPLQYSESVDGTKKMARLLFVGVLTMSSSEQAKARIAPLPDSVFKYRNANSSSSNGILNKSVLNKVSCPIMVCGVGSS